MIQKPLLGNMQGEIQLLRHNIKLSVFYKALVSINVLFEYYWVPYEIIDPVQ